MATQEKPGRRPRRVSFAAQFALVLLGVGLAMAAVAGAVAWVETAHARSQALLRSGSASAALEESLLRLETTTAAKQLACGVASAAPTAAAFRAGPAELAGAVRADLAAVGPGRVLVFLAPDGTTLAGGPGSGLSGVGPVLKDALRAPKGCPGRGYFAVGSGRSLLGAGVARVGTATDPLGFVVALAPVHSGLVSQTRGVSALLGKGSAVLLTVDGRLSLPNTIGGRRYAAGARIPTRLTRSLGGSDLATVQLGSTQYVAARRPLRSYGGGAVAQLWVVQSNPSVGISVTELALPLALAVMAVLLVGMTILFFLVEHFLNRPLRRLDAAVQRLGQDAYQEPVVVEGAEEVSRLAANFEVMRRQLRRQLLMATGRTVIASTLTGSAPLEQALDQVLRNLLGLIDADIAMIAIRPQPQAPRQLLVVRGAAEEIGWAELEGGDGILGQLVRSPRFTLRSHLEDSERGLLEQRLGLHDCVAEPLRSQDRELGVMLVANKHGEYLDEDVTLCNVVADQVVLAVDKSMRLAATQREATTDAMTGLYNYRFLVGYLDQQVNVAERASSSLSVLMMDLDHFKEVNDSHGHPVGDRVLRSFAELLLDTIRRSDLAARYGGEEFVVVMANTGREDAHLVAEKIRTAVEEMSVRLDDGGVVRVSVSIGGVNFPDGSAGARNLLDLADRALYSAKRNGRNRVEFLDLGSGAPAAAS